MLLFIFASFHSIQYCNSCKASNIHTPNNTVTSAIKQSVINKSNETIPISSRIIFVFGFFSQRYNINKISDRKIQMAIAVLPITFLNTITVPRPDAAVPVGKNIFCCNRCVHDFSVCVLFESLCFMELSSTFCFGIESGL